MTYTNNLFQRHLLACLYLYIFSLCPLCKRNAGSVAIPPSTGYVSFAVVTYDEPHALQTSQAAASEVQMMYSDHRGLTQRIR